MNLWRDVRFGFRLWRKNYGFAAVAALTLALGVGATTAIFSVVYATLFEPLPYHDPEQIVVLWSKIQGNRNSVSAGDFQDWQQQNKSFQAMATSTGASFNLATAGSQPEMVEGGRGTPGFYDKVIGETPWMGRYFIPEEAQPGKDRVVIMTHRLWERLGSNRNIVGTELRLDGEPYTVIGVRPPGPPDRMGGDIFAPLVFKPEQINHDFHWLLVFGRLKPGVSLAQAQADMDVVTQRIAEDHPKSNKGWGIRIEPLHNDFLPPEFRKTLWLLMAAVGFVLLIACVNVANLLFARGTTRQREVALRASLGASRRQVFAQFLSESMVLALIGGALGTALALAMIKAFIIAVPRYTLPSEADVRLSVPVLLFTIGATMVAGIFFGCAPAWQASRIDLNETLKESGRSFSGSGRQRLRRSLVIAEFALALSLLAGAGLAIHSFWNLARTDPGFRADHVITFFLPVPPKKLSQPEQMTAFYRNLLEKVESLPGVTRAEVGTGAPMQEVWGGMPFTIAGKPVSDPSSRPGAGFSMITPGYFQTFGIEMVRGRIFTEQDVAGSTRVAVVNENFATRFLSGVDPLTQRLVVEQPIPGETKIGTAVEWQIVGVYHDVRNGGLRDGSFPEIDIPFWQIPWPQAHMAVRTAGDPDLMTKSIAASVHSVDPDLALANVKTMDQIVGESLVSDRFLSLLYGSFAVVALLLAASGIYGVMAFMVAQRTHEIGLRIALGADKAHVLGIVLREGVLLAATGLGLGLGGACLVGRAMRSTLYGVGTVDLAAFSVVSATLMGAALLACYVPAHRAAKVDPIVALRYE
jgi:putative ABC transport system permease protein